MFTDVGFIGSGPLTQALAQHLVAAQMPVLISNSRGPDSLTELVADLGEGVRAVTVDQTAKADLVILALPFLRVPELADVIPDWTGRIVVDATNQFAEYTPAYRGYVDLGEETGSEWVARHLPGVEPEDLLTLPPRTAIASLVAEGRVAAPVTLALAAAPSASDHGLEARTVAQAYGRDRAAVEQAIQQRRQVGPDGSPRRARRVA